MAKKLVQVVYVVNDAALIKSKNALLENESAAKKADDQVKKYGKDAESAGNQASKSFLNLGNVWKGLIAIGITAFIGNLAKKTFELGVKQEQLNIAFTTFLGSAERARKLLAELNKFALVTPFTPDQVNNAAKALLAFGVQGEKILPTLKLLGDVSAGTGKDLTEMAVIFGQIRSTGRLMGQDLLQLINAGFNPLQIISEKTGRSMKALKKDMEDGNISFEMVEQAFKDATSAGGLFFNLMEKQSQTVGGLLSTIEGNIDEILKNLFTATSGPIKTFVDQLVLMTDGFLRLSESTEQTFNREQTDKITKAQEEFEAYAKAFTDTKTAASAFVIENERLIDELVKEQDQLDRNTESFLEEFNSRSDKLSLLRLEITAVQEYVKAQDKAAEAERAKATAKGLEEQATAMEKVLKARRKFIDELMSKPAVDPEDPSFGVENLFGLQPEWEKQLDEIAKEINGQLQTQQETELEIQKEGNDKQIAEEERKQARIKQVKQMAFDFGVDLLGQILMSQLSMDEEAEKEMTAKEREQAEKQKQVAIKSMIIQNLLNSIKALGTPPVPNFAQAAITAGFGLASVAVAKAVGFKEGGWITGPGTPTSDSVPIMASRDEFMVNAAAANRSPELLEAINDRRIDDRILSKLKVGSSGVTVVNNNEGVEKAVRGLKTDHYEQGHFVYKIIQKGESLKQHIRSKSH